MFPYRDENPTVLKPWVTIGLIVANAVVWLVVEGMGLELPLARAVCQYALVPAELWGHVAAGTRIPLGPGLACVAGAHAQVWTIVSSMFLHGSWFHIIGNMWFLWIFGNNIEDAMGHGRFLAFYFLCGVVAALTQSGVASHSLVPVIGASGAISGVLGAYLVLFPKVRVHTLVFLGFFVTTAALPAWVMLVFWFVIQLLGGLPALGAMQQGGVAFFAHVGGFLAGMALFVLFLSREFRRRRSRPAVEIGRWR